MGLRLAAAAFFAALSIITPVGAAPRTDLRVGIPLEPPALDPTAGAAAAIDEVVYQNIFEGLLRINQNGVVQPGLATSWEVSQDGRSYTFHLAAGVTFHDGTDLDASDVVFSLNRILAADSVNAQKPLYQTIETVTARDAMTVEIVLSRPDGQFLFNLGRGDAVIVAPESAATNAKRPIGTGPFVFVDWLNGAHLTLAAYPKYWGKKPALEKITYVFVADGAARANALLAGDLDGVNNIDTETLPIFAGDARFRILSGTTEGETLLVQNNQRTPLNDLRVRQAIAHALNRKDIIAGAGGGVAVPIGSHFPPHNPDYIDLTGTYPHDIESAKRLLAEAGYPDGFEATLKLPPISYAMLGGQIIARDLGAVGIKLKQINLDWNRWLGDVFTNKDYDFTIVSHVEPFDIGVYANPNYYFGYNSTKFQEMMDNINRSTDRRERRRLLVEAQRHLAEDAVNGYLFQLPQNGVWNAKLRGMWQNAPVEGLVLAGVHWVD